MTRLLLILILFLTTNVVQGTECVFRTFSYEHIDLQLCQNYSNYNETTSLLYKERTKQLNRFISDLVASGKLENKKITIEIYDPFVTNNYIFVSQSKSNYDIDCSGFLSFEEIAKIIFYFTQPDWSSFIYDPSKVKDQSQTRQRFLDIVNKYSLPDISSYVGDTIPLWKLDNFSLIYNHDKIWYSSNGQTLPYKPTLNLPIRIRDRYLFFQADSIFVRQNNFTILTFKIPETTGQDFAIDIYNKWVNIGFGADNIFYSYSYDKNQFYDLTKRRNVR